MLAVLSALVANGLITVLKFIGAMLTGSSGMMAESLHSLADTTNQVFLLLGLRFFERTTNEVEELMKRAELKVDMIFLETARESEPGPHDPIPQHIG